jgi:hypothetical protein
MQVFVRTVMENSEGERRPADAAASLPAPGSPKSARRSSHPDQSPWVRASLGSAGEAGVASVAADASPGPVLRALRSLSSGNSGGKGKGSSGGGDGGGHDDGGGGADGGHRAPLTPRRQSLSLWAGDGTDALETGVRKTWLGLDRRAHRFLGVATGLYMYVGVARVWGRGEAERSELRARARRSRHA